MPWADMAKKRTNLHGNAYNELPSSNYMIDYRNGNTLAKRQAIKPPQVTWSDRPPFQGQSQYQVPFFVFLFENDAVFRRVAIFVRNLRAFEFSIIEKIECSQISNFLRFKMV